MQRFTLLEGRAAALLEDDIDTDTIFPARFLLLMDKGGLGRYLFHDRRAQVGVTGAPFPLDQSAFAGANILLAGVNFGCGSSREQAVWAFVGAGFRCIIAPSFGDIFYSNCFKNGLLPVVLPEAVVKDLASLAEQGARFVVNLTAQTVRVADRAPLPFTIAAQRREALLNGRDEIDDILLGEARIASFEARSRHERPWLLASQSTGVHPSLTEGT